MYLINRLVILVNFLVVAVNVWSMYPPAYPANVSPAGAPVAPPAVSTIPAGSALSPLAPTPASLGFRGATKLFAKSFAVGLTCSPYIATPLASILYPTIYPSFSEKALKDWVGALILIGLPASLVTHALLSKAEFLIVTSGFLLGVMVGGMLIHRGVSAGQLHIIFKEEH